MNVESESGKKFSFRAIPELARNTKRVGGIVWRSNKRQVVLLVFVILVLSAAPFLRSGAFAAVINALVQFQAGGPVPNLTPLFVLLAVAVSITPFLGTIEAYLSRFFFFFLERTFELLMVRRRGEIDVAHQEDPKKNDLFQKVTENGIWRMQNFVDRQFFLIQNITEVVIASSILLVANWWVSLLILAGTVPQLIIEVRYGKMVWGIGHSRAEVRRRFWDVRSHFNQVNAVTEIKLFQQSNAFLRILRKLFDEFQNEQKKVEQKKLREQLLSLLLAQGVIVFSVIWFILEVVHGKLQIGTLTFLYASTNEFRNSLSALFMNLGRQYQDSLFVTDVFKVIDLKPALPKPRRGIKVAPNKTPEIAFENVTFAYPGTEKHVLEKLSLTIAAGEKMALVGINGAGKTTFVKLLCRFYDPTEGRILVDGRDLRTLDLDRWYHQLGVLFQDYAHYNFRVKEAIGVGRTSVPLSLPRVRVAARRSESEAFIRAWEHRYDQGLGKVFSGGVEPSIGQWQKLALARTFYRDPRILILDEPTSSIDAEAEAKIFERLEKLPPDRTVILISHRFSTVRHANIINVLEDGRLKESGTHEALLAKNGMYARLFRLQAQGYR